ncbi:hypothetical protein BGZ68_010091 [Mortierella alpina]|nr:hypothetical protein BGZ68_010091 [Mortierella alpina]
MLYEGITSITVPIGRKHEMTTFTKVDLLKELDLPSEAHLLLAGLVTSNDYVVNIPYFGISRNCDIVRDMNLQDIGPFKSDKMNAARAASFGRIIEDYIKRVDASIAAHNASLAGKSKNKGKAPQRIEPCAAPSEAGKRWSPVKVDVAHYRHAITAFVERIETPLQGPEQPADIPPKAHDTIKDVFQALQRLVPSGRKRQFSSACPEGASDPSSSVAQNVSSELGTDVQPAPASHGRDRVKRPSSRARIFTLATAPGLSICFLFGSRGLMPLGGMNRNDIVLLEDRLSEAVHIVNGARMFVFKMVELAVYEALELDDEGDDVLDCY